MSYSAHSEGGARVDVEKLVKKVAPWLVLAGFVLMLFGIICFASAANGKGLLMDAYYMMDLDHEFGRFSPGMARKLFRHMGLLKTTVSGFQRFSTGMRWPLFLLGAGSAGFGAFIMFRTGMVTLYGLKEAGKLAIAKLPVIKDKAAQAVHSINTRGRCGNCGARLSGGAAFCQQCGAKVEAAQSGEKCPRCGHMNSRGADYCRGCGRPL